MDAEVLVVIRKLTSQIEREKSRLRRMEDFITKTNYDIDGLPHATSHTSRIDQLTYEIIDSENCIKKLLEIRTQCRLELIELLENSIGNFFEECQTLIYRYAYEFEFSSIANRVNYSLSTVYKFHRAGLRRLGIENKLKYL